MFDRICEISKYKGYKSIRDFSLNGLNYKSSEKINRLKKPNAKPSFDILLNISNKFDDIDLNWLITGKGNMLKKDNSPKDKEKLKASEKDLTFIFQSINIPLYELDAATELSTILKKDIQVVPSDLVRIPRLPPCDGATYVIGNYMHPVLKSGDIIIYKTITDLNREIFWKNPYILSVRIAKDNYNFIGYIEKSDLENKVKLVYANKKYPPIEIEKKDIESMALIRAYARINSI